MRLRANRVLSVLLGAGLLAGGVTALVDGLLVAADRSPGLIPENRWYVEATTTRLGDDVVLATALIAALAGLLVLVLQLWRTPPDRVPLHPGPDTPPEPPGSSGTAPPADTAAEPATDDGLRTRWWLARRSAERRLTAAAEQLPDVADVRVRLRYRRHGWRADVAAGVPTGVDAGPPDSAPDLEGRIRQELTTLSAAEVRVRARVHQTRRPGERRIR